MEKRIELEKRGRPANQITELNLDNCRSTSIVGLTDEFTALETLSLINVGLTTLKGFPKLPSLKKLELSDNRISNGLNHLTTSENLTQLNLSGNRIKDLEELQPLKTLKNLIVLDLFNNESTSSENYRKNTFELIPSLKYLDGFDCNEAEALTDSDDDEDEDEVNGNESEEDEPFCINGIEIDLKELAIFEKRLAEKRGFKNTKIDNDNEIDDLDEYLAKLNIENKSKNDNSNDDHLCFSPTSSSTLNDNCHSVISQNSTFSKITENDNITTTVISDGEFKKHNVSDTSNISTNIQSPDTANSENGSHQSNSQQITFPLMVIKFLGILFLMNSILYSDSDGGEASDIEVESDCDPDDDLVEIYNDDLVDDNSDYVEENVEDEEDVDDFESEDEDENDKTVQSPPQPADAEAPARGKKRKHDG